jgi:uncharacterized membrane protein YphA (DoxX/SURF4 family)
MDSSRAFVGAIAPLAARCRSTPMWPRKRHCAPRALETRPSATHDDPMEDRTDENFQFRVVEARPRVLVHFGGGRPLRLVGSIRRPNVAWGSFARFEAYTARLNWFVPQAMTPTLAVLSTCVELLVGLLLVVGWHTRIAAACGGLVLILFGLAVTAALGPAAPLSFSVFSAAGGSLLLATCSSFPYSVDELLGRAATPSARRSPSRVTS